MFDIDIAREKNINAFELFIKIKHYLLQNRLIML